MDRDRFDALAKLLAASGSRRATLGALLGTLLGGALDEGDARKRGKNNDRGRNRDEDRQPDSRLQAERRGKNRKRKPRKKRGGSGGQTPPPPACCGTEACPDPEPGSTRSGCNFAGRSFAGRDHNGSTLRGIDGRGANFTATDHHGSVFAEACLQGARFRRAKLGGSTWGGACLFGADFTGADLGGDSAVFAGALFCDTTMPDGSVNDRDCGRATSCCRSLAEPAPACQTAADCAAQGCRTKACTNGQCVYSILADGPDPDGACGSEVSGHCCEGACCNPGATECNPEGLCCAPNCAGRECGPDGCGNGTCGSCPSGATCNTQTGQCVSSCGPQSCPTGCCQAGDCEPGDSGQACGTGGAPCAKCGAGSRCQNQHCTCVPDCDNKDCGPDGCGGSCGTCSSGQVCDEDDGECICTGQTCPNGCCTNGSGKPGSCLPGTTIQACGTGGEECETCDADDGVCVGGQCVECGDNEGDLCPCTGQTICDLADSAICFQRPPRNPQDDPPACFCLVSLTGESVCAGTLQSPPVNCRSDADCQGYAPGGACIAASPNAGFCPTNSNFCAAPCCSPQSCPNGCCTGITGCRPGNEFEFCGTGGELCFSCVGNQVCRNGQCTNCDPDCVCDATRDFCVSGGPNVQCQGADGADPCFCTTTVEDNPFCYGVIQPGPPSNCTNDAQCQGFAAGAACIPAAPGGSECPTAGNFCAAPCCTPLTCPNGCCFGGICVPGNTDEACGGGGVQCAACPGECSACQNGSCVALSVNGDPCTQGSQCCSGNCFNGFCANTATQCGGTACNPPANGCAGNTCCRGSDTSGCGNVCCSSPCCGSQCCGANQFCCQFTICCANGEECGGPNCPLS
jgi:hypothetical protein